MRIFAAILRMRIIDPTEELQYFSWWGYTALAAVYTAVVFSGELSKDGPLIFSRQNARSIAQVLFIHGVFLINLFCLFRIGCYALPWLPNWMTDTFSLGHGSRVSIADICLVLAAAVMNLSERRWLYVDVEMRAAHSRRKSSESPKMADE